MKGFYYLVYDFNTIVGIREPNYGDVCLSLCMLVFKKTMFLTNGMRYICYWWMILLFYETYVVWGPSESKSHAWNFKCVCVCGMRLLMMILRWDDVNVNNDIEMRWGWCWWWHWGEILSLWWCMLCMYMGVEWPCWISLKGEIECLKSFKHPWRKKGMA